MYHNGIRQNIASFKAKFNSGYKKGMEKQSNLDQKAQSVMSINGESLNMASTLKLTDNDVISKKSRFQTENDSYEPFDHRDKSHATSDSGALIHLIKSSLGSGILAMPGAFSHGGTVLGLVGTAVVGLICTHCVHLLVFCSQLLCVRAKKPSLGFAETAETAFKTGPQSLKKFSSFAREFVNAALFATYYFGNTVYVVFIAVSFQQVIENHLHWDLDVRVYILLIGIPLIPLGSVRTLKYLVPFSAIATCFIMFGLGMTIYFILKDFPPINSVDMIRPISELPLFFSTVLFAMEGIGTVLPIENSMNNPGHFLGCPGVLNIAMSLVVVLYAAVGFAGYVRFGSGTLATVTLNLGDTWLAEVVKILVALSILLTYGLQFTVPTEIVWSRIHHKIDESKQGWAYYVMRVLMIIGTLIVAIIVPSLGPFIGLVGSVCFSILGLFCPAVIEAMTYYEEGYGPLKWRLIKDIILMILAAFALVFGAEASISEIVDLYKGSDSGPATVQAIINATITPV